MGENRLVNRLPRVFNPPWMMVLLRRITGTPGPRLWLAACLILTFGLLSQAANDPGGGSPGTGPSITLSDSGSHVTINNGTIAACITKANAHVTSLLFRGREMVKGGGEIYFSMDGGSSYEQPGNCVYKIHRSSTEMVDISLKAFDAGSFTIPNVRPGVYQLSAFTDGAVGEFVTIDITVQAGNTHRLGRNRNYATNALNRVPVIP